MPEPTRPPLILSLFGPFEAHINGAPLPRLRSRKGAWLLALLALRHGREVERDWLAGTLWPESPPPQAAHSLRVILTDLRRALGREAHQLQSSTRHTLCLDLAGMAADVLAFDTAIARGDPASLQAAVALYRGPLLEGWGEEWVFQERQAREEAYLEALETLATAALAAGDLVAAERLLRRVVAADPLRQTAQRALMQGLAAAGNYAAALTIYRDLRLHLHRELNLEPDPETQALFQQLRAEARGKAEDARKPVAQQHQAADTAIRPLETLLHNLPLQLTRFIGREEQMTAVEQLLAEHRLVTLTGVGGCGKTRLALQVAAGRLEEFGDGVWLVELAALSDLGLVPQAVAAALGVREEPGSPLIATLADTLRSRSLLLVLDNCEHLLPACAGLAEALLQSCANLRLLATSREGLRIAGEATYRVPPLSLPPAQGIGHPASGVSCEPVRTDTLMQFEAPQLFVERATAALPSFMLNDQNAAPVARVCHRLDGLPLAIVLAAVRVKALPVEQINERLDDRFHLLTGGSRTALPRQQTLRATIDWSYDLLSEPERMLLRRLSVFAGGWTLEAAEAVCGRGHPDSGACTEDVLDLLTGLIEKSLVVYQERETEARYHLLETILRYAREKLAEAGESERARQRHRDYCVSLAEEAATHIYRAGQAVWQKRLEREHDNLRAALEWSLTADGGAEAALRLVGALGHFWLMGSHLREGGGWTTRTLAKGRNAPPLVLARALTAGWYFAFFQGDYLAAGRLGEEALEFSRQARDRWTIGLTLFFVAIVAVHGGEYEKALACAEEGMALAQAEGDRQIMGYHLVVLGTEAWMRGDYAAARTFFRDALQISRDLADEWHIGVTLANLGFVTRGDEDREGARALHREGLPLCQRLADRRGIGWHLVGMAGVEMEQGRAERAARLLGAAATTLEVVGSPLPPPQQREHDRTRDQTQAAIGEGTFSATWAEGQAMTAEVAILYALEEADSA